MFILVPVGVLAVIWVAALGRRQKLLEGRRDEVAVPTILVSPWSRFRSRS
jgi:hypothetical protein